MNFIIFGAKYLYLFIVVALIMYFLFLDYTRKKEFLVLCAIYFSFTFLIATLISACYYNPRPFVVGSFQPLIAHSANNGFPSDHMLFCSAISSVLFIYNKNLGIAMSILE